MYELSEITRQNLGGPRRLGRSNLNLYTTNSIGKQPICPDHVVIDERSFDTFCAQSAASDGSLWLILEGCDRHSHLLNSLPLC